MAASAAVSAAAIAATAPTASTTSPTISSTASSSASHPRPKPCAPASSPAAGAASGLWTHVPELSFDTGDELNKVRRASTLRGIDAVIAAHAAPSVDRIMITVGQRRNGRNPARFRRLAPWLRFASLRLAGELSIRFARPPWSISTPRRELEVPACERATAIDLQLPLQLRLAATGRFAALRVLTISCSRVRAGDLDRAVSTQCPCLQELALSTYGFALHGVSIRSDSLERLKLSGQVANRKITVDAPRLVRLEMSRTSGFGRRMGHGSHINAPELAELIWHNLYGTKCDQIVKTRRHLQRLVVVPQCSDQLKMSGLLARFRYVDELDLHISIPCVFFNKHGHVFKVRKLPRCKVLKLHLTLQSPAPKSSSVRMFNKRAFVMRMMPLLPKCAGIKKLYVCLDSVSDWDWDKEKSPRGRLAINTGIFLGSLEEIEFVFLNVKGGEVGLVRIMLLLLLKCGAVPQRVIVHATSRTPDLSNRMCEKIAGFCHSETNVEFYRYFADRYGLMWSRNGRS